MSNWKQISIGEFVEFNPSESIPKGKLVKKIPMAKLTEFVRKIDGHELAEYNSGPKFRNFDTLVAKITPCLENGKTAFVDILEKNEVAFGSSEFIVLRENEKSISEFVYYLAKSPVFRERAISCMEGTSGRKRVNEGALKRQEIIVPDKQTQKKIAKILSDLDAKIELNNKINAELEAMAKMLYDYWFVQFDFPVQSKTNPKLVEGYKTSGGKMAWNEELKREIPEEWEVKYLSDICEIINGFAFKSEWYSDSGIKIIRTKNFENGYVDLNDLVFLENEFAKQFDKYQLKTYDFLMVMVGASTGKHCTVNSNILPALQNQNMWRFISKIENQQLFLNLKLQRIVLELENTTNGSARGFFQKDSFLSKIVEVPNRDLIENFCNKINGVFKSIDNNLKENQELASLRDWLLPMLMNGQVSVGELVEATEIKYKVEDNELGMVAEGNAEYKKH